MNKPSIKILECFNISHLGIVTEIQHTLNGIKPDTVVLDVKTGESWCIKKRMLSGLLLTDNEEVYFECETKYDHISMSFANAEKRRDAISKELARRQKGIYWYVLEGKNTKEKPKVGSHLYIL